MTKVLGVRWLREGLREEVRNRQTKAVGVEGASWARGNGQTLRGSWVRR